MSYYRNRYKKMSKLVKIQLSLIREILNQDIKDCTRQALEKLLEDRKPQVLPRPGESKKEQVALRQKAKENKKTATLLERRDRLIREATFAEKKIKILLKLLKIEFIFQQEIVTSGGSRFILDFYFPKTRIGLEIDGGYHDTIEQKEKDLQRTFAIIATRKVSRVIRLDNKSALEMTQDLLRRWLITHSVI